MARNLIKIYGERNTGTNYLHDLIGLNLDVELLPGGVPYSVAKLQGRLPGKEWLRDIFFLFTYPTNLGWKHSLVKSANQLCKYRITSNNLSFITLTKNPYSWLVSLYKRPYHQYWKSKPSFDAFLCTPWQTLLRENARKVYQNPIEIWNDKNRSYIQLGERFRVLNLTFESLLADPENTIETIKATCSLTSKTPVFTNIEESTKKDSKSFYDYQNYYLNEIWRNELTDKAILHINRFLDNNLLEYYGYHKLSKTGGP